jgi:hypothetical protein
MAHTPLKITIPEVQEEVRYAWENSYSPEAIERALEGIADEPAAYKISHLLARLFFRGIYFPQKGTGRWLSLAFHNRRSIFRVLKDSLTRWHGGQDRASGRDFAGSPGPALAGTQPDSGGD